MSCRHSTERFKEALRPGSPVWYAWAPTSEFDEADGIRKSEAAHRWEQSFVRARTPTEPESDPNCHRCQFVDHIRAAEAKYTTPSVPGSMPFRCTIELVAKETLHSMAFGPDRLILEAGESIVVTAIWCHNGPYTYYRERHGWSRSHTVPRSWLVECGALAPIPDPGATSPAAVERTNPARGQRANNRRSENAQTELLAE